MLKNKVRQSFLKLLSMMLVIGVLLPNIMRFSYAFDENSGTITVTDYEITEKLYKEATETIYDGTYVDVVYENTPKTGYNYLLVKIDVIPIGPISADNFNIKIGNKSK